MVKKDMASKEADNSSSYLATSCDENDFHYFQHLTKIIGVASGWGSALGLGQRFHIEGGSA